MSPLKVVNRILETPGKNEKKKNKPLTSQERLLVKL